ncbi:MAG: uncharacterized membrane protein YgdD (TMEM256/DUF423 family) [Verrucomicrobiales bacterium]|jgi:uncharacterized membrane protein YgdD (TMEM256/DUF423 family)
MEAPLTSEQNATHPSSRHHWQLQMRLSGLLMAAGVALGAYGAHGLEADAKGLANWKTAVLYHLIHGLALYFLASQPRKNQVAWWCLFVGILIFSGMLYTIVLTGVTWLGAIVPIGGLAMIIGWLSLALSQK